MQDELARIRLHLTALRYTRKEVDHLTGLIAKWTRCSGIEWTVERIKSLKLSYYNFLSTESVRIRVPSGWATRTNNAGQTIFKDRVVQSILSRPVKSSNEKANFANLRKIEGFFRVYTSLKCDNITPKQRKKMVSAVTGKSTVEPISYDKINVRHAEAQIVKKILRSANNTDNLPNLMERSMSKRSPYVPNNLLRFTEKDIRTVQRDDAKSGSWRNLLEADDEINIIWAQYPDEVDYAVGGRVFYARNSEADLVKGFPAGKLTVIQEGGAKARWIANPFLVYQAFGEGLKEKLDAFIKHLYPEVMTYDQEGGLTVLEGWVIEEEAKVYSYDCKSFTDRFPLSIQCHVLEQLIDQGVVSKFDYDVFKCVVSKPWLLEDGGTVKWEVGQPLGFGPSFHLATLTHAVLLDSLRANLANPSHQHFMIVGDDVVIKGDALALAYLEFMTNLGVEIDPLKSMESAKFAEFLGKLVSTHGVVDAIKVKELRLPEQIQSAYAYYGRGSVWTIPIRYVGMSDSLYKPTDLGGEGWVMDDMSHAEWLEVTPQNRYARERIRRDLESFFGNPTGVRSKERRIQLRSDYYSLNLMSWGASETHPLCHETNAEKQLTVTPVGLIKQVMFESIHGQQSFATLVDTMLKLEGYSVIKGVPILNKYGYLYQNEKPYTANHFNGIDDNEQESPNQGRKSFYYSVQRRRKSKRGKELKRFLKYANPEGKGVKSSDNATFETIKDQHDTI